MGVLAVEIDEVTSHLLEGLDRSHPIVDVGPRSPVGRDHGSCEDDLLFAAVEVGPRSQRHSARPGPHDGRVGARAEQQLERLDDEGLSGPGLARDDRQTVTENQIDILDHPEVPDAQLPDHGVVTGRSD